MIGTKPATKAQLAAGKTLFVATCSACHTLKAAGALGNIGPVLDKVPLPEAMLIKAITKGGSSVMTKAAIAKYTTQMVPYGDDAQGPSDQRDRGLHLLGHAQVALLTATVERAARAARSALRDLPGSAA